MPQIPTSAGDAIDDANLLLALEQNEFDIAGLADFSTEDLCINHCLRQLCVILQRQAEPSRRDRRLLAQVLVGMIAVARSDYAAEGHQEYWPFLFRRIRRAAAGNSDVRWRESFVSQQNQNLLGRWFRLALETLGYSIPEEGTTFVGPIVFHSGIPYTALPRVLEVISIACDHYGSQVVTLPADIRAGLVTNHFLHRNVERLLASNSQGASQLWGCLARVVLARNTLGDCSEELQQLPLSLDPEKVRLALPTEVKSTRIAAAALPQLRYDSATGEIRLCFPASGSGLWRVLAGGSPMDLPWSRTHVGMTAEFRGPLPQQLSVECRDHEAGMTRTFCPQPLEWPGYWFHAHNGNIEDGRTIDASGLAAGRWYVVFEGTPSKCSVPYTAQVQLKWSWFKGNSEWTAWEIEVPPCTAERSHLEWFVGDNCFRVPLARRPGPRVKLLDEPIARAFASDGNQLDIFSSAPFVALSRESSIEVQLLVEANDSVAVVDRIELQPEKPTRLPTLGAGVYQLRESRGVGRTLLHFAIIPRFQVQLPHHDGNHSLVTIKISADDKSGHVCCDNLQDTSKAGNTWIIRSSTVEPFIKATWCWSDEEFPALEFRWPVEALRWRVTQLGNDNASWTRESIFVSPKTVAKHDSQLEIQIPVGTDLSINGELYEGRLQNGPSGNSLVLSLLSYGQSVELSHADRRYAAVIQSERPLLNSLNGAVDSDKLIVSWQASSLQPGTVIVAWDPLTPSVQPKTFSLTENELKSGEWRQSFSELPGAEWTSLSLASSAGGFFQRVLHMASRRSAAMEPISLLLNHATRFVNNRVSGTATWVDFLHAATLTRLHGNVDGIEFHEELVALSKSDSFKIQDALTLVDDLKRLRSLDSTSDRDRRWADTLLLSVCGLLDRFAKETPARLLSQSDSDSRRLEAFLELGIPLGQAYPFRWISDCGPVPDSSVYPFAYIRDLWLLGTDRIVLQHQLNAVGASLPENYSELQMDAARDVLAFHNDLQLPSLSEFLPLGAGTAIIESSDQNHRHSFALPPISNSLITATDLCENLGFMDKAVDCQGTSDDQFFSAQNNLASSRNSMRRSVDWPKSRVHDYSLFWCSVENRWAIEHPGASSPTCCFTNCQPLLVNPLNQKLLASNVLRNAISQWAAAERSSSQLNVEFAFLDAFRDRLFADETCGLLHAELLRPTQIERKELFGKTVEVETAKGLSDIATIAWQLAWIERVTAWEGIGHIFEESPEDRLTQREFLQGLARSIELWPGLMKRCIAVAELVYWTLYRGGLGVAARFRSTYTDSQLSALTAVESAHLGPSSSQHAVVKQQQIHALHVPGIILGYNAGLGIVLLQNRNSPSLDATVADYLSNGYDRKFWFASFRWRAISSADRERLHQIFSKPSNGRRQKQHTMLGDVMCGMQVTCEVWKRPKWEVTEMEFEFKSKQFEIPKHLRKRPR